jgi:S-adenosylmethionine synthetase
MSRFIFTSESVSEGHPDKVCDYISDSILDACFEQDPQSRVACETLCKSDTVVLAGEITTGAVLDYEKIVRDAVREIGYTDRAEPFCDTTLKLIPIITQQSSQISQGVTATTSQSGDQGAGDQGIMFGYATDESDEMMPLPILLAHRLTKGLTIDRKEGKAAFLRPDSKSQVSILYEDNQPKEVTAVVVSTQHTPDANQQQIAEYVRTVLGPRVLGTWWNPNAALHVNPTGDFSHGGPSADAGVTGRKIIVDTYGGWGRHGGGAFSGKDPSKVDRSSAYFCRYVAKQVVASGLAKMAEIQVGYAIGMAKPVSVKVDTFGTGDERAAADFVMTAFDFRVRLPPARDHRAPQPAPPDLPQHHQLRALRPSRAPVGGRREGRRGREVRSRQPAPGSRQSDRGRCRLPAAGSEELVPAPRPARNPRVHLAHLRRDVHRVVLRHAHRHEQ